MINSYYINIKNKFSIYFMSFIEQQHFNYFKIYFIDVN